MATIFTVHGTFASGPEAGEKWWQRDSPFERHMREMVAADAGELHFNPKIWDGLNSETSRRRAGYDLAKEMQKLEKAGEPYAVVGHSHGGSVIAAGLMASARNRRPLERLRAWISVGTPFIQTQKEPFLFQRLGPIGKAIYVALLTAFILLAWGWVSAFGVNYVMEQETAENKLWAIGEILLFLVLSAVPFGVFYLLSRIRERGRLYLYDRKTQEFAKDTYRSKWLSLWHPADEAVQGLRSLRTLKFEFFARNFATASIGLIAVFVPPLLFLAMALSPPAMRTTLDWVETSPFFDEADREEVRLTAAGLTEGFLPPQAQLDWESLPESERTDCSLGPCISTTPPYDIWLLTREIAELDSEARKANRELSAWRPEVGAEGAARSALGAEQLAVAEARVNELQTQINDTEAAISERYVRLAEMRLIYGASGEERPFTGEHTAENVRLITGIGATSMLNLIQYESDQEGWWAFPRFLAGVTLALLAMVLVLNLVIRGLAGMISALLSRSLNPMTMGQIKATAFGSDTPADYAVHAEDWPMWNGKGFPPLPTEIGGELQKASDDAIGEVIPKFRDAVRTFSQADDTQQKSDMLSEYLTWDELIHTSYFKNPAFRKLIAYAICQTDGFKPTPAFEADPDYARAAAWHRELTSEAQTGLEPA